VRDRRQQHHAEQRSHRTQDTGCGVAESRSRASDACDVSGDRSNPRGGSAIPQP
jgi:hypothetical protein